MYSSTHLPKTTLSTWFIFLSLVFGSLSGLSQSVISPFLVTEPVAYDSDDPAIWINKKDPAQSLIIGTDKASDGALYVYDLSGKIVDDKIVHNLRRPNNVDVAYGLLLNGKEVDIAVTTERETSRLRIYSLPDMQPVDNGGIPVFTGETISEYRMPMGIALYTKPSGEIYAVVSRKSGPTNGTYLWQYLLKDDGSGTVTGALVRKFGKYSGQKEIESVAADNELGYVYYSDEGVGVRKYYADPEQGNEELALFATSGFTADHEGISIYKIENGTGYILVSDQQANEFHIFTREGAPENPHDHQLVKIVKVAAQQSDGSELVNFPLMPNFPRGLFVAMSDDKTFQLYRWDDIAGNDLKIVPPFSTSDSLSLVAPLNNALGVELSPTLVWNTVAGATGFKVQVSATNNFSELVFDGEVMGDTVMHLSPLEENTVYFWRVMTVLPNDSSTWSPVWSFHTLITTSPLVGHWNMEEGGGDTLLDVSLHGNNAIISGSPEWIAFGAGRALHLNGVDQFATVPNSSALAITQAITLSTWIRPEQIATQNIIKKATSNLTDGFELSLSYTGKVFFRINQAALGNTCRVNSESSYPSDGATWMHVAATYDGVVMKLYINGVEEQSLSLALPTPINLNSEALSIGAQQNGQYPFKGALDEVQVYNKALSAAEIEELAKASNQYLVGNWKMEEGGGTVLVDSSPMMNNGFVNGSPLWVSGKVGQGLQLDGHTQNASVPNNTSLNPTAAITLAAWIKPGLLGTQDIINKAVYGSMDGYELSLSASGKVFFRINEASSSDSYRVNSTSTYPTDGATWMHVAATYDGVTMKLYINGIEEASLSPTSPPALVANDRALSIGAQSNGTRRYSGVLDEVLLYATALSAAEIATLAGVQAVVTLNKAEVLPEAAEKPLVEVFSVYPNPIIDETTVRFALVQSGYYELVLYDVRGIRVAMLGRGIAAAGVLNALKIQGSKFAKGIYIVKLQTGQTVKTLKLLVTEKYAP